jgi:hypothetical protein
MIVTQDNRYHVNPRLVEYVEVTDNDGTARVTIHMASGHELELPEQKTQAAHVQAERIAEQVQNTAQRMAIVGEVEE